MKTTPFRLTPDELAAIDRNHARLVALGDGARTLDMFAQAGGEDLTLTGEIIRAQVAKPEAGAAAPQLGFQF